MMGIAALHPSCRNWTTTMAARPFDLSGKIAVVTGGNGGIGLGMARGLAGAGAAVIIAARNAQKSRAAVDELTARGASALAIETDVTDEKSIAAMVETTIARCGRLD